MEFVHKSIMLEEVIESLAIKPNGIYVDGTLGGAGHSSEIVKRLGEDGRLIGIDQDGEAIEAATKRLKPYKDKVTIVRSNYEYPLISLIMLREALLTGKMYLLICVWIRDRQRLRKIS